VTTNLLEVDSSIQITFPSDFYSFGSGDIDCNPIKNVESTLVCTATESNVITITNGYEVGDLPGGSEVGLRLNNINNPT
jgi:hypothetical protein